MQGSSLDKSIISRYVTTIVVIAFLISAFSIVFATLSPFKFNFLYPLNQFNLNLDFSVSSVEDCFRNIILFIPFSFTLSLLFLNRNHKKRRLFLSIFVSSFLFSLTVEILQLFLPQRTPTLIDIISNSLGGYIGCLLFKKAGSRTLDCIRHFSRAMLGFISKKRNIIILMISYCFFVLSLTTHLNFLVSLNGWDSNFPLVIGNELTGDRPWDGYIKELYIFNRELSAEEIEDLIKSDRKSLVFPPSLLVAVDFRDSTDYKYAIPNLPPLTWFDENKTSSIDQANGVSLDGDHWLKSAAAVTPLIDEMRKSSQLSIITNISTKNLVQEGPARIVSISKSPFSRNITLGQKGSDLIVRTRTPFTRGNAARPSIVFPDIFVDTNSHYLAYTYNSKQAKLYVDDSRSVDTVVFNFAAKFFWSLNDLPHFPVFTPNFIYPESSFLSSLNIIFYITFALPILILSLCFLYAA